MEYAPYSDHKLAAIITIHGTLHVWVAICCVLSTLASSARRNARALSVLLVTE